MSLAPALRRARPRRAPCALLALLALSAPVLAAEAPAADADTPVPVDAPDRDAPSPIDSGAGAAATPTAPVIQAREISLTSTRMSTDVLDTSGNVTLLDRETIEKSGARDVPDLLRREAGLYVTNTTSNREGNSVEARGFNNGGGNGGRTLVLIDGRRVNEENTATVDWSFIALDNIEHIEVVRGPVSAAHGDNALAGVVQIFTRHPVEDGVSANLRTRTGSYDTFQSSAQAQAKHGPVSASAFFDYDETDAFRVRANHRARDGQMQLRFDLGERGFASVQGGYAEVDRLRPGTLTAAEMEVNRRQAQPGSADNFETARRRFIQGTFEFEPIENVKLRILPFHSRKSSESQFDDPTFAFESETEQEASGVNSQVEFDFALGGMRNRLLVGADLLVEHVDNGALFTSITPFGDFAFPTMTDAKRTVVGFFAQNELWITDEVLLSLGVRRDEADYRADDEVTGTRFKVGHSEWAPRASLLWRFCECGSAYVSYSRGFRFPNLTEVFGNFGNNPGLVPETSDSYEVGLKLRSERSTLNLSLYQMNVWNEILFNPEAVNPFFLPLVVSGIDTNLDRVRHRGVEMSASVRLTEWLEIFGTYTYDDAEIRSDGTTGLVGNVVPITPTHRGTGGVRLLLPYGFEASVNARWVGSRVLANDLTNSFEKMNGFGTVDARIGWRHAIREWLTFELEAVGYNLTGRRYNEFGGRSAFPPLRVGYFPNAGSHYLVGARVIIRR